ncbi:hypothetical protein BDC45DRAFT_428053, partial [Circinella umbellata]
QDEKKKKEFVSSELILSFNQCLSCQNKLIRPHTLPCGYTICQSCFNNNSNKQCISPRCQRIHTTPIQTNVTMDKILNVLSLLHDPQKKDLTKNILRIQLVHLLECPICCSCLYQPCTVPCGHTFCRSCLVRSLDHTPSCPICRQSISWIPSPTLLLSQLVESLFSQPQQQMDTECQIDNDHNDTRVPIFIGSLAFPHVKCVLHIYEPRYRLMLRRIMESRRHRFAMCLTVRKQTTTTSSSMPFYEFGTMLELTHVQTLEDGRSIVQAVGSHRFRVLSYHMVDGYPVGELERIDDIDGEQEQILERDQIMSATAQRIQRERQESLHQQQRITSTVNPAAAASSSSLPNNNLQLTCRGKSSNTNFDRSSSQLKQLQRPRTQIFGGIGRQQQQQQRSWAAQAHPQTTQMSRSPWLQMHLRGLSPAQAKIGSTQFQTPIVSQQQQQQQQQSLTFHNSNNNLTTSATTMDTNNRYEEISTDDLIQQIEVFITLLQTCSNSNSNNNNQMAQFLNAFGNPPPIQGPRRNRIIFTWWVANMMPLNHEEKAKLLAIRIFRERVLLLIQWVDRLKDQWSFWFTGLNNNNHSQDSSS